MPRGSALVTRRRAVASPAGDGSGQVQDQGRGRADADPEQAGQPQGEAEAGSGAGTVRAVDGDHATRTGRPRDAESDVRRREHRILLAQKPTGSCHHIPTKAIGLNLFHRVRRWPACDSPTHANRPSGSGTMPSRRTVASAALGLALAPLVGRRGLAADGVPLAPGLAAGVAEEAVMDALPGKRPLIKLSYRPPNYETPLDYFGDPTPPNDAFFARSHTADTPEVDAGTWRRRVGGAAAAKPFEIGRDELPRGFEPVELVAVCQCSGNRRG